MTEQAPENPVRQAWTVTELTLALKRLIDSSPLHEVIVEGEMSGVRTSSSGHLYFTLKDSGAVLPCAMFANALLRCRARESLKEGAKVRLRGTIDVYPPRGAYQLIVLQARLAGEGDLWRKFAELKAALAEEGLFDDSRKRPIPPMPRRIGIVTSPTGAVIHDLCTTLTRRFPALDIMLYPVKVQGEGASAEIANAIAYFNSWDCPFKADVMIVGRGGGSLEDLWPFNEETTVRAVAASHIPVISAVGHESDTTLCDYAADLRAGTPSNAAEIAVPVMAELERAIQSLSVRLAGNFRHCLNTAVQKLDSLEFRLSSSAAALVANARARIATASNAISSRLEIAVGGSRNRILSCRSRLAPALSAAAAKNRRVLDNASARLAHSMRIALERKRSRIDALSASLAHLDVSRVLKRGYTITADGDGRILASAASAAKCQKIKTRFFDGEIVSSPLRPE